MVVVVAELLLVLERVLGAVADLQGAEGGE